MEIRHSEYFPSLFSSFLIFPLETFIFLGKVFCFYSFAFPKIFSSFSLVIWKKETIEGIPKEELLDFIIEKKKFPAKEVQERFGISAKKY